MADLPQGVTDPLDPAFQTDDLWTSDAQNAEKQGNVFVPIGALPDDRSHDEPTAEAENAKRIAIRHFADYVQGLAPVTALDVAGWLGLPTYATGSLPAASAPNEGRVYFDTTTNRIVYDNGGALVSVASTTDVAGAAGVHVAAEGGSIDDDYDGLEFDENTFDVVDNLDGTVTITVGEIEFANLPNGSAQSILGRSANSSGVLANIAGTGTAAAPQALVSDGTAHFVSLSTLGGLYAGTIYDVDFSSLATNAFTDGTEVIDGLSWTVAGSAGAGTQWGITNTAGLRWSAPTSAATSWTIAAPTSPHLYLPVSSLPNFQGGHPLIIDLYLSASTFENGNDAVRVGLWDVIGSPAAGSSTNRFRGGDRGNAGGTQTVRTFDGTTATANVDTWAVNAISCRIEFDNSMSIGVGTYSGGWPQFNHVQRFATTLTTDETVNASTARLVLAFINASDASPTTAVTIARMRVRRG